MKKQTLFLGITLFSMFFGAGNLIFAPWLGVQASSAGWLALAGFLCTAVVAPISVIVIIAPYGSAKAMISRIWKPLGPIFMTVIYLLIGPVIAIPRTASTSMEMWTWLIGNSMLSRIVFTVCFFIAASLLALYPGKLKDFLGRLSGPVLLVLILMVCIPVLFIPSGSSPAQPPYDQRPFLSGFNEGYQTMDILAAFCFGLIILLNIRESETGRKNETRTLIFTALIAGFLLAAVYGLLAWTGMRQSFALQEYTNGAQILSILASSIWGKFSQPLIGMIFLLACCNVCAGLLACCAEYFSLLIPKAAYRVWLIGFAVLDSIVALSSLDSILSWSGTLLTWICPIAILLLLTGLIHRPKAPKAESESSSD